MKTTHIAAAIAAAALTLCGGAYAQDSGLQAPAASSSLPDNGSMSSDTNGSSTMPADITPSAPADQPGAVNGSGTSAATGAPEYNDKAIDNTYSPSRDEVNSDAAGMTQSQGAPRGEQSIPQQDKGSNAGSN